MVMPMAVPAQTGRHSGKTARSRIQFRSCSAHPFCVMSCCLSVPLPPRSGIQPVPFILSPSAEKCVAKSCWFRYNLT